MGAAKSRLRAAPGAVRLIRFLRRASFAATSVRRDRQIDAYLRNHSVRKLQLGTGSNLLRGWLNTDVYDDTRTREVVYLDARSPFPVPDASFDVVFTEHMIEHMPYRDALSCLRECRRILRPGGRIRVATPSLRRLAQLYAPDPTELQQRYVRWSTDRSVKGAGAYLPGFVLNNFMRDWGHQFVFDEQTLQHALKTAGFEQITEWPLGESDHPDLAGLERHGELIPLEFNEFETLVLEATRPQPKARGAPQRLPHADPAKDPTQSG